MNSKEGNSIEELKRLAIILGIVWTIILIGDKFYSSYLNRITKQFGLSQRVEANTLDICDVKDDIKTIKQDIKILIRRVK